MKKILAWTLALALAAGCGGFLSGCGGAAQSGETQGKGPKIVCTIFPIYDFVREIMGDRFDETQVSYLADDGSDYHSFQPSAADVVAVTSADLFICVGGKSDAWSQDALKGDEDTQTVKLTEVSPLQYTEETSEGMQAEAEEDSELDEHVWLSLKNAAAICGSLCQTIGSLDPENAETYEKNTAAYVQKLQELDGEYEQTVKNASKDVLIFADRFPFRYLAEDYGIKYYAAFPGCSSECDASFETVMFLAQKLDEYSIKTLLITENSAGDVSGAVIDASGAKDVNVAVLDSMQSVTAKAAADRHYLIVMEKNLEVIREALG